jgi:uncharacterized protein
MLAALFALIFVYGLAEPYWIEVRHVQVRDPRIASVLRGAVIVHLTDLHMTGIGRRERRVLSILDDLRPDIILLTGDYVQWQGDYGPALEFLSRLKATIGVWAVMGDADYSRSRKSCLFCHEEGSGAPTKRHAVRFLRDSMERIELPGGPLVIAGTDVAKQRELGVVQAFLDKIAEPAVVLAHNPLTFDQVRGDRRILVLAGDTHGGQLPIPDWLVRLLGRRNVLAYSQGLFVKGSAQMYVGRGIGTSRIPLRLFRRPEVTVFHFDPKADGL